METHEAEFLVLKLWHYFEPFQRLSRATHATAAAPTLQSGGSPSCCYLWRQRVVTPILLRLGRTGALPYEITIRVR